MNRLKGQRAKRLINLFTLLPFYLFSFLIPCLYAQTGKIIKLDGSSTVFPVAEAVAEEFQNAKKGAIKITVGISGTGGGFKKFCRGATDIQNASRPILAKEMKDCETNDIRYYELPICFDALTVAVHPKNTWVDFLTVEELKKMWEPAAQGKVTRWNQIRSNWPNEPFKLFGAGADSGTFDYFTEAIVGKAKSSRGDYTASEDDNVLVQGVARDKNALGFFGFSYYEAHKDILKAVPIHNGKKPIAPSSETVLKGDYLPLSRPLFIYVNSKSASQKLEVKEFVEFYLKNVKELSAQVKYIPLSDRAYQMVLDRFLKGKQGTVFGGALEAGRRLEEILKRVPK